jgi:hypothetical protein
VLFPAASLTVAGLYRSLFGFGFLRASEVQEVSRKVIAQTAPSDPDSARRMHVTGKVKAEALITITAGGSGEVRHPVWREPCL